MDGVPPIATFPAVSGAVEVERLASLKARQARKLVLLIPAKGPETKLDFMLPLITEALVRNAPLVDDVVVLVDDRNDPAYEAAMRYVRAGVQVIVTTDSPLIRSGLYGQQGGKGTAMWVGIAHTTGDIIFCDADMEVFDPTTIATVAAPLLTDPTVGLVKAASVRHFGQDKRDDAGLGHGGRNTELVVRAIMSNQFSDLVPGLWQLQQPLEGLMALRRPIAEQLAIYSGYGVEIAMNIHVADYWGLEAIAQAETGKRVNANKSNQELAKQGYEIKVVADGLEAVMRGMQVPAGRSKTFRRPNLEDWTARDGANPALVGFTAYVARQQEAGRDVLAELQAWRIRHDHLLPHPLGVEEQVGGRDPRDELGCSAPEVSL